MTIGSCFSRPKTLRRAQGMPSRLSTPTWSRHSKSWCRHCWIRQQQKQRWQWREMVVRPQPLHLRQRRLQHRRGGGDDGSHQSRSWWFGEMCSTAPAMPCSMLWSRHSTGWCRRSRTGQQQKQQWLRRAQLVQFEHLHLQQWRLQHRRGGEGDDSSSLTPGGVGTQHLPCRAAFGAGTAQAAAGREG